jgi:hypothetical protein
MGKLDYYYCVVISSLPCQTRLSYIIETAFGSPVRVNSENRFDRARSARFLITPAESPVVSFAMWMWLPTLESNTL